MIQFLKKYLYNHASRETIRLFLFLIVGIHGYALYQAWTAFNKPPPPQLPASTHQQEQSIQTIQTIPSSPSSSLPASNDRPSNDRPSNDASIYDAPITSPGNSVVQGSVVQPSVQGSVVQPNNSDAPAALAEDIDLPLPSLQAAGPNSQQQSKTRVDVDSKVATTTITSRGGNIRSVSLANYFNLDNSNLEVLTTNDASFLLLQSGVVSNSKIALPTMQSEYLLVKKERSADGTTVAFRWVGDEVTITKQYLFTNNSYEVAYWITAVASNSLEGTIALYPYVQQVAAPKERPMFSSSYYGAAVHNPEHGYKKISYDEMQESEFSMSLKNTWMAFVDQYFTSIWIPDKDATIKYSTRPSTTFPGKVLISGLMPGATLAASDTTHWDSKFFIGPKSNKDLKATNETLSNVIDYGILGFLSKPMFWLLNFFHGLTDNWGWSIVLLTFVIRAILYKPAEIAFVSMARIKKFSPEMTALKERYGSDRQRMGVEMMKLYKEHKINPLTGCLPILLQIPVFIALFWMLSESVELKYAPFIFWITDLSVIDPYFVLPLLMAMSMIIQQKLTTQPTDPLQQKMFSLLPIIFGFMSVFFPSGLVLYWVVNNVLSIMQQTVIEYRLLRSEKT